MKLIAIVSFVALMMMPCIAAPYSVMPNGTHEIVIASDGGEISPNIEPAYISISGEGQEASQIFALTKGLSIFTMKHSGSSNFIIWLLDHNGKNVELLVNEIGDFNGSKAVGISTPGDYILDISADGPWMVNITQPTPRTAQNVPVSFNGFGPQVSQFFTLKPGLAIFKMAHNGESNFAIWLRNSKGDREELLVNEIGTFDGSKAIGIKTNGIYCLDIDADGDWNIDISQ